MTKLFKASTVAAISILLASGLSSHVMAQDASAVSLSASHIKTCAVSLGTLAPAATNAGFTLASGTLTIPSAQFANAQAQYIGNNLVSGNPKRAQVPLSIECNHAGWAFSVKSVGGGMKQNVASPISIIGGTFATRVDYKATVQITDADAPAGFFQQSTDVTSDGTAGKVSSVVTVNEGAFSSANNTGSAASVTIALGASNASGTAPMIAGTYTDTVTILFKAAS